MFKVLILFFLVLSLTYLGCNLETDHTSSPILDIVNSVSIKPFDKSKLDTNKTFYVDTNNSNSDDNNIGSEEFPWKTISHAVSEAGPGIKIVVKSGVYNERVKISAVSGGTESSFAVFEADGYVEMKGFSIFAPFVAVLGFTVKGYPIPYLWGNAGIWIGASNLYICDNEISNFTNGGAIICSWSQKEGQETNDIYIVNNVIQDCNRGINADGNRILVEGNKINHLIKEPTEDFSGLDADYVRFFGDTIIIRNNLFYGSIKEEVAGTSHVDIFQSQDNNNVTTRNVLIEKNICLGFYHQGLMIASNENRINTIENTILYRNVFEGGTAFGVYGFGVNGLHIINNSFINIIDYNNDGSANTGTGVAFEESKFGSPASGSIINNIFYNCKTSYWKGVDRNGDGVEPVFTNSNNLEYLMFRKSNFNDSTDLIEIDPLFYKNPENTLNTKSKLLYYLGVDNIPFTSDDGLNLKKDSPAIGTGLEGRNIGAY